MQCAFALQNVGCAAVNHRCITVSAIAITIDYTEDPFRYQLWPCQKRFMSKSAKVQRRSRNKRESDFELVMERQKTVNKVLTVMEILKHEPEQVMTMKSLGGYRSRINLANHHRVLEFVKKYSGIFELYKDPRGVTWCGFTPAAEELIEEEMKIKKEYESTTVNYVRRFLMMSVDKELPVDKIAHFKQSFGLPDDFRREWIYKFPEFFKVVQRNDGLYLKLTSWDPSLAFTELERKAKGGAVNAENSTPGLITLPFPVRFPSRFQRIRRHYEAIKKFQALPYLSPYANPSDLVPGSKEFGKRAVAVLHEMLSFTLEKRLVTDHLTHFRREFRLPQKLMRLFLRHFGIFYVSEKGTRFNVFLTTAYDGSELIQKSPLVLWKDKVAALMGERRRRVRGKLAYEDADEDTVSAEIRTEGDYKKEGIVDRGDCYNGYERLKGKDEDIVNDTEDDLEEDIEDDTEDDLEEDVEDDTEDDLEDEGMTEDEEMDVEEVIRAYES